MRYFIVFYKYNTLGGKCVLLTLVQNEYPNKSLTEKLIEEKSFLSEDTGTITNIIELNETDFNNFIK